MLFVFPSSEQPVTVSLCLTKPWFRSCCNSNHCYVYAPTLSFDHFLSLLKETNSLQVLLKQENLSVPSKKLEDCVLQCSFWQNTKTTHWQSICEHFMFLFRSRGFLVTEHVLNSRLWPWQQFYEAPVLSHLATARKIPFLLSIPGLPSVDMEHSHCATAALREGSALWGTAASHPAPHWALARSTRIIPVT